MRFFNPFADPEWRATLQKDRNILLVCFGLSLVSWFFITMSDEYTTERTFQVRYMLPDDEVFVDMPNQTITATISGKGWDLAYDRLSREEAVLDFELAGIENGIIDQSLLRRRLAEEINPLLTVDKLSRNYINLQTDPKLAVRVPVRARITLEMAPQHYLADTVRLVPDSVTVAGPRSLVQELTSWPTVEKRFTELRAPLSPFVELEPPTRGQVTIEPARVTAVIEVQQFTEKVLFVPVGVENARDSLRIFPNQVEVRAKVGVQQLDAVTAADFRIVADMEGIKLAGRENARTNSVPLVITQQPSAVLDFNIYPKSAEFFFIQPVDSTRARPIQ